jgi:hypothetical protein
LESKDAIQTPVVTFQVIVDEDPCGALSGRQLHALRLLLTHSDKEKQNE